MSGATKMIYGEWFVNESGNIAAHEKSLGCTLEIAVVIDPAMQPILVAAPAMLEALHAAESVLWMAEEYAKAGGSGGPEMREFKSAVELIDAAIRKATT